ncbi:PAS domain-containing protein [Palleronia aestuarii]|uniref:PAS domain-containing protein n=1 Tax=Palleronia aestuarii TaxID=568105 RepID=A0A2W7P6G9_9RHOB|nr:PAS-domain containing protein [Palleronia aestuarii]PZX18992.1 PAS domain-containing protein [Palleronia aestuarii]
MVEAYVHTILLMGLVGALSASAGAGFVLWRQSRRKMQLGAADARDARTVFLFEGETLVDLSGPAQDYLDSLGSDGSAHARLMAVLGEEFPDLPATLRSAERRRIAHVVSRDGVRSLAIGVEGPRLRLTLEDAERDAVTLDRGLHAAIERELEGLRAIGESLPYPIWREDAEGRITWVNRAYLQIVEAEKLGDTGTWPPPPLFRRIEGRTRGPVRLQIAGGGERGWYDCHAVALDGDMVLSATPADALVAAEESLRSFVQSFSNTFAHLDIGLAVFDRRRQLILTNPALGELTSLPSDLLISRPSLDSFLDALRVRRVMPEPKEAANWRETVQDIEHSAANGTYAEMWHLSGGRTYRVSGRPQPGGAVAFLFEDISAELRLTKQFRAQIETGHAVLDALEEAIAVFDSGGTLVMSNEAYDAMWEIEPMGGFAEISAADALRTWTHMTEPTPIWGDARVFLSTGRERSEWSGEVQMRSGRPIRVTLAPLPDAGTLVRFEQGASGKLIPLGERRESVHRIKA